ncbi:hypothetical protein MANY_25710 [Mycolicibacterium anyangense]|uniref:Uncharacterized protein n=1 Tax=Mycolicibacterium anyangense TaxID=1431246 RepID=A0A6N4WB03_9MYCO|nr:hypothetical protein MANY_25710 [Mycolicibacterium anyangense]
MVAAAVVVANPVAPPIRDMQISTTQLSTSPQALIPFDKSLLNSISQQSAPFGSALAQILGALAAEADRIGNDVNSTGFEAAPVPPAALTAAAYPPPPAETPFVPPNGTPSAAAAAAMLPAAGVADVQQVVTSLVQDTTYLGSKVVEAAYAAVDVLVNTPSLIVKAIVALIKGDLVSALNTIVDAIKAFFGPGQILIGGLQGFIDSLTGQPSIPLTPTPPPAASRTPGTDTGTAPAGTGGTGATPTGDPSGPAATTSVAQSGRNRAATTPRVVARSAQTDPGPTSTAPDDNADSAPQPGSPPTRTSVAESGRGAAGTPGGTRPVTRPKPHDPGTSKPATASAKDQSAGGQGATAGD